MNVIVGRPPNFDAIVRVFPLAAKNSVLFTWGYAIYSPGGDYVSPELLEHERVHAARQALTTPEAWWDKYLVDPEFRLNEEVPAHKAEYQEWCKTHRDRNSRAKHLAHVAMKLASPLYVGLGAVRLITPAQARELIR